MLLRVTLGNIKYKKLSENLILTSNKNRIEYQLVRIRNIPFGKIPLGSIPNGNIHSILGTGGDHCVGVL